jgi:peptide-methionine (S)-S-oxide reductase
MTIMKNTNKSLWSLAAIAIVGSSCIAIVFAAAPDSPNTPEQNMSPPTNNTQPTDSANLETATFASGCFWCSEAVFQQLRGVKSVVSGYSGGLAENPTYEQVCSGTTGYAEAIQVKFDPAFIPYTDLLQVFWQTHDPTTLNRQGNDIGTQYRSAVFYHNDKQRKQAQEYKQQLDASKTFSGPIVTEITQYTNFIPAEKYHQDYYQQNPNQGYCQYVIRPKVEKFRKQFANLLQDAPQPAEAH